MTKHWTWTVWMRPVLMLHSSISSEQNYLIKKYALDYVCAHSNEKEIKTHISWQRKQHGREEFEKKKDWWLDEWISHRSRAKVEIIFALLLLWALDLITNRNCDQNTWEKYEKLRWSDCTQNVSKSRVSHTHYVVITHHFSNQFILTSHAHQWVMCGRFELYFDSYFLKGTPMISHDLL